YSIHGLTYLYISALGTIAALAITGQIVIQLSLLQQSSDASVINIAGRQRMLSQQISKDALAIEVVTDPTTHSKYVQQLQNATAIWQQVQQDLQQGNATLDLSGHNSEAVTQLFNVIEPSYEAMLGAAKGLLSQANLFRGETNQNTAVSSFTQTILAQEPTYLE